MKTYLVLNKAPCHEDVWGSGGISTRINVNTTLRWVVSFMPRPLYPAERAPVLIW